MENKAFEVYCCNGHSVDSICNLKSCPHPAAICREEGCQYSSIHNKCISKAYVKDLVEMFEQKVGSSLKKLDEVIIGSINKMIKELEILKIEYLQRRKSIALMGDNMKVFDLLKNGPAM